MEDGGGASSINNGHYMNAQAWWYNNQLRVYPVSPRKPWVNLYITTNEVKQLLMCPHDNDIGRLLGLNEV